MTFSMARVLGLSQGRPGASAARRPGSGDARRAVASLAVDADLLERASRLLECPDPARVAEQGLVLLVARESARQLAALGGTEPDIEPIMRARHESPLLMGRRRS